MGDYLSLTQIWALPDFAVQYVIHNHGYQSKNYVIDRLLVSQLSDQLNFLNPQESLLINNDEFTSNYQSPDANLVRDTRPSLLTNRFDLIRKLSEDVGDLYTFGANKYGQLGISDERKRKIPTSVPAFQNIKVKFVS